MIWRSLIQRPRRFLCVLAAGTLPCAATPPLDEAQMRTLMEQAQQMQECMGRLDQAATTTLQQTGEQVAAQIDSLCKAGRREEAQAAALAFGRDLATSPALAQMRECGAALLALLPAFAALGADAAGAGSIQVCDMH